MRSNPHAYARKLRARVMRLLMKKLIKGFPVVFPGKYLKNNT
jgi:hypothetical protein